MMQKKKEGEYQAQQTYWISIDLALLTSNDRYVLIIMENLVSPV